MKNVMKLTSEEKSNQEFWWALQQLKCFEVSAKKGGLVAVAITVRPIKISNEPSIDAKERALLKLEELKGIIITNRKIKEDTYGKDCIYTLKFLQPKFDELYKKYQMVAMPEIFKIQVKDNYIWINDYLLSKPHAVGSNLEFFEYIKRQTPNTKIERNKLPDFGGLSLKQEVKNKSFIKILNELGFKGEILKTFFPKRGKNTVVYRGDKITKKDLEGAGIKIPLFLKELELAHLKNSPE